MNVFFRQTTDGYEWLKTSDDAIKSEYYSGSLDDFASFYTENANIGSWVLVTSSLDVIHKYFNFSAKEKKHIEQAVPFMLEEDVITDIDDLHFVTHKNSDSQLTVIAVEKNLIGQWLKPLAEKNIAVSHCIAPYNLMPDTEDDWLILYRSGEYLIKTEEALFAVETGELALCLELLTDNFADLPKSIQLVIFSDADEMTAMSAIPEALHHMVNCQHMDYGKLLQAQLPQAKKWSMLTGHFSTSNNWLDIVKPWRWVIMGLCLIYITDLSITAFKSYRFQQENKVIKTETDKVFRQIVPRGVIVDYRRQLNKVLKTINVKNNTKFSGLMATLVPVLSATPTDINSINYDNAKSELRLDLVVDDFTMLESIMNKLKEQGFVTEIQNSSQQDDKLRVRLRVEG